MRIEFTNIERQGLDWNRRDLRIGRDADNDLVLDGPGVAPHHVTITHDARGLVLTVQPGAGRVYLNARQVRVRALVRAGDNLGIGDFRLRLCSDRAAGESRPIGVASLRVVAGPLSGRACSIGKRLDLCNGDPWPLGLGHAPDACISLVREDDGIHLGSRNLPEAVLLSVNGVVTREAPLRDGDQITIGPHRFVLDACAVGSGAPDPAQEGELPEPLSVAGPRREVWWLILTAAILALVISILFLV